MFLNDSNRAKVLALLLVFGLNNDCGAMDSISSMKSVDSSTINHSNDGLQNAYCGDLWQKFHEKICERYGHSVLTDRIWDKMQEISMKERCCDTKSHTSNIEHFFDSSCKKGCLYRVQNFEGERLAKRVKKDLNIFEVILNGYTWNFASNSQFMLQFESMFKEETKKMWGKKPQELLDEYWIPEFGVLDYNMLEKISSWNPYNDPESSCLNESTLVAYALPTYDPWLKKSKIIHEFLSVGNLKHLIEKFVFVVGKINKIIFEHGKPLRYYSGEEIKNLSVESDIYNISSVFEKIVENSDRAAYFLTGRDKLYLTNFGILLISRVLESFINQAIVSSGLSDQMFDYIEITGFDSYKVFKDNKQIELSPDLYETVCKKLKDIYILNIFFKK